MANEIARLMAILLSHKNSADWSTSIPFAYETAKKIVDYALEQQAKETSARARPFYSEPDKARIEKEVQERVGHSWTLRAIREKLDKFNWDVERAVLYIQENR